MEVGLDLYEYGEFAQPMEVDELLRAFSGVLTGFEVVPICFRAMDSVAADPALWLELNREISRVFAADDAIAGIVVTHGTSALRWTRAARALS